MKPTEEIKIIFTKRRWAAEELVYDQKLQEATDVISGRNQKIYDYLIQRYGSLQAVLGALNGLLRLQDGPRKALLVRKGK